MLDKKENALKNDAQVKHFDEKTNENATPNKNEYRCLQENDDDEDDNLLIQVSWIFDAKEKWFWFYTQNFIKHALKIETSLNETPLKTLKKNTIEESSPSFISKKETSLNVKEEIPSVSQENKTSNADISIDDSAENEKYIKVLKRYFGFSKFRP